MSRLPAPLLPPRKTQLSGSQTTSPTPENQVSVGGGARPVDGSVALGQCLPQCRIPVPLLQEAPLCPQLLPYRLQHPLLHSQLGREEVESARGGGGARASLTLPLLALFPPPRCP